MAEGEKSKIEEAASEWRQKIGRIYTSEEHRSQGIEYTRDLNTEVTRDGIRNFIVGLGDVNPIYWDEKYARKTKYGNIIAPPSYAYTITYSQGPEPGEVPAGVGGFYSGSQREWFRPLRLGERINYRVMYPSDVVLRPSKFSGTNMYLYEKCDYITEEGELVAAYTAWEVWAELSKANDINKYQQYEELPVYSDDDLKEIYNAQDAEVIRGAVPRYWEDIEVGEDLPPVVRGPYTLSESNAFIQGVHAHVLSDRLTRLRDPRDPMYLDSNDPGFSGVSLNSIPPKVPGLDRFIAAGMQPEMWRNMVITNWMGDDGFLWKSNTQIRGFTMQGDTIWCKGKVIDKYYYDGKFCVDIDLWCENQMGNVVIPGTATVILPSRDHGPVVYPEPHSLTAGK